MAYKSYIIIKNDYGQRMPPIFYIIIAITIITISIVLVGIVIFLIYYLTQKKYNNFVLQNSIFLHQLDEINCRYDFYPYICFDQSHTYDNEKFFNIISCMDYLIYQLQYIRKKLFNQIDKINSNKQQYSQYLSDIKSIAKFGEFRSKIGKLNLNKLIKIEKALIEKHTYHAPITQFYLTVTLYCSTINGRIYSKKSQKFSADNIFALNKRLNNRTGNFYNDREIWDALCRVERGKVSNKMRFSIYERDRYRCRKCGAYGRYAQLEIDHIIPIAKGGKSTYDNLQTLCHNCNVEKGDTYKKY